MFNMNEGVISYITRDGKEGKLNVNLFNMKKINNLLSKSKDCFYDYFGGPDLDFVHFKNVVFDRSLYFEAGYAVIFENCIFKGRKLVVSGGSIDIINPLKDRNGIGWLEEIEIVHADDVKVIFNDNNSLDEPIEYNIFAQNIEIDGGKANLGVIDGIDSNVAKNISFNNLEVFNVFHLEKAKNLSLCNSVFKGNFSLWLNIMNRLYLNNVQLSSMNIDINCPNIKINDVTLTARDYIKINDDVYSSKNGNPIVLNDSDLLGDSKVYSRRALISILKGYRDLVQGVVVKEKERDAGLGSYNRLISNVEAGIKLSEDKLEMDRAELEDIKCSRDKYSKKLERCLLDKNAYDYIKKGN